MKPKTIVFLAALTIVLDSMGQNPIIRDQFAADPTARVFNGKMYLFPSHDIWPPEGQRQDWFCMGDYHVFSSENLTDWTDHGVIVSQEEVPWGNPKGFSMWAPDCVNKNGKYYFYFPNAPCEGRGFAIGVATADLPEGPYTLEQTSIKGVGGIDPCVLIDDDGQAYIYWSSMGLRGAKLKENMTELDGESQQMEGLPEGFKEGPYVFRRGDWYYLTFPWVRHQNGTEALAYAMSKSPLGPWDFKRVFMEEHKNRCWTNHHSFVEYKGQWYLFYHHNDYSPRDDKRRSARIEKVAFHDDGTIEPVIPTLRGVGISSALSCIEIDRFSHASEDVHIAFNDSTQTFQGWHVTLPTADSWVQYNDVDINLVNDAYLVARIKADNNSTVLVHEKNAKGPVIAKIDITVRNEQQNSRRNLTGQWLTWTAPLNHVPKGITDLVVTCQGGPVSIDWLQVKNRPNFFHPSSSQPLRPTEDSGFICRWRLREPIPQNIRMNTVFTDTWLRSLFNDELKKLPKQKAKWYNLDSDTYNMKLFHFAERYGKQTYGNLFWCEAYIDCAEDIPNVRLAAGSNGASMWWLHDEEVLLLSGDRRMVVDDGVSNRINLRKGLNVLRCAVVNGPGLSDMCARFIDEKGNPITNYLLKTSTR